MTTTAPPAAFSSSTLVSSACSTWNCNERSSVSTRSSPGTGSVVVAPEPGIDRPLASCSRTRSPSTPVSSSLYSNSRPAVPMPSMSVRPNRLRPTSPLGMMRLSSRSTSMPLRLSDMTAPAMSSSIWRAMYTKLLSLAVNAANSACCFSCGNCNIVARTEDTPVGSVTSFGLAMRVLLGTLITSSPPSRAKMVPRGAYSTASDTRCALPAATSDSEPAVCRNATRATTAANSSTLMTNTATSLRRGSPFGVLGALRALDPLLQRRSGTATVVALLASGCRSRRAT